jgi:hypothetical protein
VVVLNKIDLPHVAERQAEIEKELKAVRRSS